MAPRLRIGLTGGIASGKSTVTQRFAELGVPVIDADVASRSAVEPGKPGLAQVVKQLHDVGFSTLAGQASVTRTIVTQAYLLAADDIFWASGWICLAMIGMVWLCRRAVSGGGTHAAAD